MSARAGVLERPSRTARAATRSQPCPRRRQVTGHAPGASPLFLLGTHQASWLWDERAACHLFVSHRRLKRYKRLYPATHPWALDSGGFTELSKSGRWITSPREYAEAVARYEREIGQLLWAAPMDWMCEPVVIYGGVVRGKRFPGTHLSVGVHQHLTVLNYVTLINLWPEFSNGPCPFIPVLQGWTQADYDYCAELYAAAGVDLTRCETVGLGSVCRRQSTVRIGLLASWLATSGIRLHGFGVKTEGLGLYGEHLVSCDSLAWSYDARRSDPLPGHTHKNCASCLPYAMGWRQRMLAGLGDSRPALEVAA